MSFLSVFFVCFPGYCQWPVAQISFRSSYTSSTPRDYFPRIFLSLRFNRVMRNTKCVLHRCKGSAPILRFSPVTRTEPQDYTVWTVLPAEGEPAPPRSQPPIPSCPPWSASQIIYTSLTSVQRSRILISTGPMFKERLNQDTFTSNLTCFGLVVI